jgi:(1->4)-alpha-D-glucan 1-alpha-D-glucosylmutase
MFYQLLLGAWPAELTSLDPDATDAFAERVAAAMIKSLREARLHSSWAAPNAAYEDATVAFVRLALDVSRPNAFLDAFLPFQKRVARLGVRNSLLQTILKLTLPGMPDIYQGAELWDLNLVDPDNRRTVDFASRTRLLTDTLAALQRDRGGTMLHLLENWQDGRCKLAVIATLLTERNEHPKLFAEGGYEPLPVTGPKGDQICAFARSANMVVIGSRFPVRSEADPGWDETRVALPDASTDWRDVLTGRVTSGDVQDLLSDLPVAVLVPA